MARNNDMDAISALLGLGILGAMGDVTKQSERGGYNPFAEQQKAQQKAQQKVMTEDEILKKGAVSAWKLYHSYIDVGFESEQAFELLKLALSARR